MFSTSEHLRSENRAVVSVCIKDDGGLINVSLVDLIFIALASLRQQRKWEYRYPVGNVLV
jgi:hypothetical protein